MADASQKVVYAALLGNILVALTKYGAAAISGSSAMLTEAVHSSADSVNQVLLIIGDAKSRGRPDREHAFGYGMEIYFWAFVVAVMVLLAGGLVSLVQGVDHLRHLKPIESPALNLAVLALSAAFEGYSLRVGYKEFRRMVHRHPTSRPVSLFRFIILSKDPNLYESLLEDSAALIGIGIAAVGVLLAGYFRLLWADGAASIAIGILLIANSAMIALATRSLITGETVAFPLRREMDAVLAQSVLAGKFSQLKTLHLGPRKILVTLKVKTGGQETAARLVADLETVKADLKRVDERITWIFFDLW